MQFSDRKSHERLTSLPRISFEKRLTNSEEGRNSSQSKYARYSPLQDAQIQIYLGKRNMKRRLQAIGYILNPQDDSILKKVNVKSKTTIPKNQFRIKGLQLKNKNMEYSISKLEYDIYIQSIKKKMKTQS